MDPDTAENFGTESTNLSQIKFRV